MTEPESVARVRAALAAAGHADTIARFPAGTRTAEDAARAVGCAVGQIAKSIVFRSGERAVVVVASGTNRVDRAKVAECLGKPVKTAGPDFVLSATGFSAGGVSPVGLDGAPDLVIDRDLLALDPVWAAAGSPEHSFRTTGATLATITGGRIADVRQDR